MSNLLDAKRGLVKAILESPGDASLRLILADAIEEDNTSEAAQQLATGLREEEGRWDFGLGYSGKRGLFWWVKGISYKTAEMFDCPLVCTNSCNSGWRWFSAWKETDWKWLCLTCLERRRLIGRSSGIGREALPSEFSHPADKEREGEADSGLPVPLLLQKNELISAREDAIPLGRVTFANLRKASVISPEFTRDQVSFQRLSQPLLLSPPFLIHSESVDSAKDQS